MSKLSRLMAMAAITAAASQQGMTDLPVIDHRPLPKHKGESPKCKTCIYFECAHCCMKPMGMACEDYKRKQKKR